MKRKLLFMMLCIVGALSMSAQDYTSKVGTAQANWGGSGTYGSVTTYAGTTTPLAERYGNSEAITQMKQTVTGLEKGMYEVTVFATSHNAWNGGGANLQSDADDVAYIYTLANGETLTKYFTARRDPGMSADEPYKVTISDITVSDGTLEIGLALAKAGQTEWHTIQIYQLTRTGAIPLTNLINAYNTALASARTTAAKTDKMSDAVSSALNTAISTYSTVDENSEDALNTAIDALTAATSNAESSIASYKTIASGTIATNNTNGWAISTSSGSLACNTWSVEADTDGSGMTTPFIQDWAPLGTPLGEGKLYYTLTGLNPGEEYNVTARTRVFNESAGSLDGGSFFVNEESISISENGSQCTGTFADKGKFGVFTVKGIVDNNGVLQFGISVGSNSALNWVAIKDVTIAEVTGHVPTDITLDPATISLTIGESASVSATVLPADADDKTLSWTSSNTSVATVVDGVVSAVGIGTATITATATAATSVTATCNVTVSQAEAPSFYSSELIDGEDYFVMNAATGKFLGGQNSWGTQISLIEHGIPFTAAKISDDVYTLDSHTYNSNVNHFLSQSGFIDNVATNLTLTDAGNGAFIVNMAGHNNLTAQGGTTIVSIDGTNTDAMAQWYFISKKDWEKAFANATADNPQDATFYISDPNFSRDHIYNSFSHNGQSTKANDGTETYPWTVTASNYNLKGGAVENFCAESYRATFEVSQELTVANGTYKLRAQACAGSASPVAVVFANDQETSFVTRTGGENSMTGCSNSFSSGKYYTEWITVTVTDRKLKIGVKSTASDDWCVWDNFELYKIDYTPVTSIEATIDNDEIEEGNNAQITATVTPENASFDKVTYTSSDESIATVDENGQVTAVAEGEVTITVAAEMEDVSATVDVTVVKPAVLPETIAVYNGEEEVTELEISEPVTLTAVVGPEGAAQTVTFVSDNEEVVTVDANGTVTPVLPGTANITVASAVNAEVAKTVSVTVAFDETEIPEITYVNDGSKRTYSSLGENIIKNGAFEYPDAFYNWTQAKDFTTKITSAKFSVAEEDGNKYLVGTVNEGAGGEGSLGVAWPIEAGKSYVFSYRVKNLNAADGNHQFLKTSLTNEKGTETKVLGTPSVNKGQWATVKYAFTNDEEYQFLQIKFRWLSNQFGFDDFYLCEATATEVGNVDYITENVPTSNIGDGVFQYNQDNIDAATGLTQATPVNQYTGATVSEVQAAYDRMMTLNPPARNSRYALVVATPNHAKAGNAVVAKAGNPSNNNPTGYGFNASAEPNVNLAQAWAFKAVEGKLNTYNLYYTNENDENVYLTYGALNGSAAGWKDTQIQATTVVDNAGEFQIVATSRNNVVNIMNTITNSTIACQDGGNIYTEPNNADFTVQLAEPAVIEVAIAEGAYATRMFPFKPEIPSGVVCYEVEEMNGTSLVLKEVSDPQANTPYILYSEEAEISEDVEGYGTATSLEPVEKGLLVGTLADENTVPAGNYVLQTLTNGQKFYKVASDITNYPAYRAYLKGSEVGDGVKEIGFADDDTPTGINAISEGGFNFSNIEGVYDLSGAKIGRLQKGTNVVRMKDGSVRKVLVK